MEIIVEKAAPETKATQLMCIGLYEDETKLDQGMAKLDSSLGGMVTELLKAKDFAGKLNQTALLYPEGKIKAKRLLLVGMGKKDEFNLESVREVTGKCALQAREVGAEEFAAMVFGSDSGLSTPTIGRAMAEAAELALYRFDRFKSVKEEKREVRKFTILLDHEDLSGVKTAVREGQIVAEATKLTRDLANLPSSDCPPSHLAEVAKGVAKKYDFKCKVLDIEEMEKRGMGGIAGVGRGSSRSPKLILMEYTGSNDPPIAIVGKGVVFDSGGISIKPSEKMEDMKFDKSGAAAVIGVMQAVASLKLPVHVIGVIPAVENLPSGTAYRPGDVLRTYSGKTVEVINTDAEGRLILADALVYACEHKPQAIVDLATLTGACVVALGNHASGLMTNNQELAQKVIRAGEESGERVWQLPLWKEYYEQIKSNVADMKNIGGKGGGPITAAALLGNFVGEYPWVHLDIAGTAWTQDGSAEKSYVPKGATGVGVRLLVRLLEKWDSKG